jgi:uroporphyrinogen decarboxylase
MNSKQRVHAALRKEPVDRLPIFMWFHPETARRLGRLLDIPVEYVAEAMGNDIRQTWVNNNYAMEGITHEHEGESHVDFWGIRWVRKGPFNQIAEFPLAGKTQDEVLQYEFPYQHSEELLQQMVPVAASAENTFIGCDVSPCIFEMYWRLRGMEDALLDIAGKPDLARQMFRRCAEFSIELGREACRRFPLDWFWAGDDVASQLNLMMSPETWREFIRPDLQRIFAVGKEDRLWVAYHCCGALRSIIEDLIDIGLDVLNPVQCNCPGMDPLELKREYGAELAFMGGVDTQGVLPNGTADDVRRATARLVEGMTSDGGGFILAASHTIPPETPDENVFAMYSEAGITREEIFDRAASIRKAPPVG